MKLYNYRIIRLLIGGRWERHRVWGWYRMNNRRGPVPVSVVEVEDNTDDVALIRALVVISLALAFWSAFG